MNLTSLVAFRALAMFALELGKPKEARAFSLIADGIQAGRDVDQHMQAVADALNTGAAPDWDDLVRRLEQPI
jgi:hypothetical protein